MSTTLQDLAWPVSAGRITLRELREDDAAAIFAYRRRDEVTQWMGGRSGDRATFEAWFLRPERAARTLVVEHEGRVVGDVGLIVQDGWADVEVGAQAAGVEGDLGWCLDPAYGGRGLATEAIAALLGVAFDGLGLRRVTASCFVANEPSWRLMERLGTRREQHGVRDSLHRDRGWLDGYTYALLAVEWRSR